MPEPRARAEPAFVQPFRNLRGLPSYHYEGEDAKRIARYLENAAYQAYVALMMQEEEDECQSQ